jgi:Ca2+-binding EF-hand superfamily protein
MSTISGISGASSAWSEMSSARASSRSAKMFSKVDTDTSGTVDATELQSMLDDIQDKTGNTLGSASDLMSSMDSDGSGGLSADELDTGMKSLMPAPGSTVDFAQQSSGGRPPPPPDGEMPPPPPPEASSSTSSGTDPLDTNGDGIVSAEERAAGAMQDAISNLFAAADTDGDKSIGKSEADPLATNIDAALEGLQSSSSSSTSDSSNSASDKASSLTLSSFIELALKQYGQTATVATSSTSDSSISVSA